jgi:hypothetical protein
METACCSETWVFARESGTVRNPAPGNSRMGYPNRGNIWSFTKVKDQILGNALNLYNKCCVASFIKICRRNQRLTRNITIRVVGAEKNAAYLELHTHTSRYKNSQSFVSNDPGDRCCCCAPPLDATSFENGYPQQRSWCVLQLAKKESVTAVQRAFPTQFHMEQPSRVSI